jgi:Na+/H+-dicarboxylate symporter
MTSTTCNILIGPALGVATGLFLGENAEPFQLVAEGYLRLLQMTVLPYVHSRSLLVLSPRPR